VSVAFRGFPVSGLVLILCLMRLSSASCLLRSSTAFEGVVVSMSQWMMASTDLSMMRSLVRAMSFLQVECMCWSPVVAFVFSVCCVAVFIYGFAQKLCSAVTIAPYIKTELLCETCG
jgi:hypothetical protein